MVFMKVLYNILQLVWRGKGREGEREGDPLN
jgi:hypothetical protein